MEVTGDTTHQSEPPPRVVVKHATMSEEMQEFACKVATDAIKKCRDEAVRKTDDLTGGACALCVCVCVCVCVEGGCVADTQLWWVEREYQPRRHFS